MAFRYITDSEIRNNWATKTSLGKKNGDKCFYVLRTVNDAAGLYSTAVFSYIPQLIYCEKKGYIPVVDWSKKENINALLGNSKNDDKTDNYWEHYFNQPVGIAMDEVIGSQNVVLGFVGSATQYIINGAADFRITAELKGQDFLKKYGTIYNRYIRVNEEMQFHIDLFFRELFKEKRTLGIYIREGFRRLALLGDDLVKGHPRVMEPNEFIRKADCHMKEWGCEQVFVVSDDEEAVQLCAAYFGKRMIKIERERKNFFLKGVPVEKPADYTGLSDSVRDYVIEIELLAKCDALFGPNSSGFIAAMLRSAGCREKKVDLYDLGLY